MTIQTTIWSLDTCGCVVEYTWDDTTSEDTRVHTFKQILKRDNIPQHAGVEVVGPDNIPKRVGAPDGLTLYTIILGENNMKNQVLPLAQTVLSSLVAKDYLWVFDQNRVLYVSFSGKLTPAQVGSLQTLCDTSFGAGKVVVSP